jgi:hypothetical protein
MRTDLLSFALPIRCPEPTQFDTLCRGPGEYALLGVAPTAANVMIKTQANRVPSLRPIMNGLPEF